MTVDQHDTQTIQIFKLKGQRGRPKTRVGTKAEKNAEDQKQAKEKRKAAGMKLVSVWLTPESQQAVEQRKNIAGETQEQAINELLTRSEFD